MEHAVKVNQAFDLDAELHEIAMNRLHSEVQGVEPLHSEALTVEQATGRACCTASSGRGV